MTGMIRTWLLGITGAAILTAFAESLMPAGGVKQIGKLVCGLVLVAAVLRPLSGGGEAVSMQAFNAGTEELQARTQQLKAETDAKMREVIEEELAAYSMDKAAQLGISCQVRVACTQEEDGIFLPQRVQIWGVCQEEGQPLAAVLQQEFDLGAEQIQFQEGEEP